MVYLQLSFKTSEWFSFWIIRGTFIVSRERTIYFLLEVVQNWDSKVICFFFFDVMRFWLFFSFSLQFITYHVLSRRKYTVVFFFFFFVSSCCHKMTRKQFLIVFVKTWSSSLKLQIRDELKRKWKLCAGIQSSVI